MNGAKSGATGTTVYINGEAIPFRPGSVRAWMQWQAMDPDKKGLAVAVNGMLIRRADWSRFQLSPGDRVEIVEPLQGG